MEKFILAIDSGTTSNRAILFDHGGKPVGQSQSEFNQIFPSAGRVEHDAEEIWDSQLSVIKKLFVETGIGAGQIAAIGVTNQRETVVIWDRETGKPVYNAIVWQDRRTAGYCDSLKKEGREDLIRDKTGLVIDAYFSASKIRWILENIEGTREKAEQGKLAFGTIDSWLIWKLSGGRMHITDVSNASRTMLYNIHTLEWDKELLNIFEVPAELLPEVRPSSEIYGETDADLFGTGIPVSGIAGDQQAALFGQMCTAKGMVKNTYGTGCFVVMNTGDEPVSSEHKLLTTIAWQINDKVSYAIEGSIFVSGALVQWLRDKLRIIKSSSEIEKLALKVKDNGGVYFVPAFVGLGAPHWDPYATGTLIGITRDTSDAHIARAALESIALQSMDVIRTMELDSGITMKELRVDGGAAVNDLLMQIQADLLGKTVVRPKITETTALGAAYLAGLGIGFWTGIEEIRKQWQEEKTFRASSETPEIENVRSNWARALDRSRDWNRPEK
ncbi:MAG TPA: glycerol kinase [Bacteroides sp.]|nr:glycerol kinase [Bacteroides sp.]